MAITPAQAIWPQRFLSPSMLRKQEETEAHALWRLFTERNPAPPAK